MVNFYANIIQTTQSIQSSIYNIGASITLLLVGLVIGLLVKKILYKIIGKIGLNQLAPKKIKKYNLQRNVSSIISYVIYVITIIIFLDRIGIGYTWIPYFLGSVLLLLIFFSMIVWLKDAIPSFIAGVRIKKIVHPGDKIKVQNISGKIVKMGYFETIIKTEDETLYFVNSLLKRSLN